MTTNIMTTQNSTRTLFLVDAILQALILLPMLYFDILTTIGIFNSSELAGYVIFSLFITAPMGLAQIVSSLIWVFIGKTKFHKIYLPVAIILGGTVAYFAWGGQKINSTLFWYTIIAAKFAALFYWVTTLVHWRRAH